MLIHAGGSGVGTAATQLSILANAKPIVTAGSTEKINMAKSLGAVAGFNYKEGDFSVGVKQHTKGTIRLKISTIVKAKLNKWNCLFKPQLACDISLTAQMCDCLYSKIID